jgi:hypothetical protein
MSPVLVNELNRASQMTTGELPAVVEQAFEKNALEEFPDEAHVSNVPPLTHSPASTMPGVPPPARLPSQPSLSQPLPARRSKAPWIVLTIVVLGGAGAGGWYWWQQQQQQQEKPGEVGGGALPASHRDASVVANASPDAVQAAVTPDATEVAVAAPDATAAAATPDASAVAVATPDAAAVAAKPDAAVVASGSDTSPDKQVIQPSGASDSLEITSKPAGARVFLDGADQGTTPLKLNGSSDRHSVAVLLAGYDLYQADVDGHGKFTIDLKQVTPPAGPAGIKVLKCKKDRYYVFVDDKPTGMLCPTERIGTEIGTHTVEVYDAQTESRHKWDISIKDTRLSFRVRVE